MTKLTVRDRERLIYLAIWRKALAAPGRTITFTMPSPTAALSLRMLLYRVIKPYRADTEPSKQLQDLALREAAESLQIAVTGPDITIGPRRTLGMVEGLLAELGITEADIKASDPDTAEPAGAALARVLQNLAAPADPFGIKPQE
jgi:hypothetical protein